MVCSVGESPVLVLLPILCPFVCALLALANPLCVRWQRSMGVLGTGLSLASVAVLLPQVHAQSVMVVHIGGWEAPFGISFVADRLSTLMVAVTAFISFFVAIYAWKDISDDMQERFFTPLLLFLVAGAQGAYLTGDLFNLYVWFEVLLVSSFILMVIGSKKHQLQGALKYVVLNLLSSALFLIGAGLIYGKVGTLNMADIHRALSVSADADLINSSGVLLFVAFAIKAGVFPLCFWLPASYHTPPASVTALFAGIMTKVGVYAMFRGMTLFLSSATDELQPVLMVAAMATIVVGVLGAVGQYNIRMILSIHIISQVGYIIAGFAMLTVSSIAAGMFYMVHNIIVKTNLLLIGGVIHRIHGRDHLSRTGDMIKTHPSMALAFFVSAFSLAGLPPLSGFWAKFGVLAAAMEEKHWLMAFTIVSVSLFTLLSMVKIWIGAFWQSAPQGDKDDALAEVADQSASALALVLPCFLLAFSSVLLGVFGSVLYEYATMAARDILNTDVYLKAVLKP